MSSAGKSKERATDDGLSIPLEAIDSDFFIDSLMACCGLTDRTKSDTLLSAKNPKTVGEADWATMTKSFVDTLKDSMADRPVLTCGETEDARKWLQAIENTVITYKKTKLNKKTLKSFNTGREGEASTNLDRVIESANWTKAMAKEKKQKRIADRTFREQVKTSLQDYWGAESFDDLMTATGQSDPQKVQQRADEYFRQTFLGDKTRATKGYKHTGKGGSADVMVEMRMFDFACSDTSKALVEDGMFSEDKLNEFGGYDKASERFRAVHSERVKKLREIPREFGLTGSSYRDMVDLQFLLTATLTTAEQRSVYSNDDMEGEE